MAKVTTTEQLIELIKRSRSIPTPDFAAFFGERASESGGVLPSSPQELSAQLVQSGLLTAWQLDQLIQGKYRGFRLGKYTLKGHLGTGGMSSVYLSEHPIMRRPVAIKVLPKTRVAKSSYLERFELEARAVAALDHPNIVRAYDIDNEGDTHYIVMEYVEGKDLQRIVEHEGQLGYERAADYIAQAAVGLQHAHEAGIVHRDIKPANCLVDLSGVVKVLDMGLAKFAADDASLSAVHKDSVVGTADYLAPEQAVNSSQVDSRADVYGLGGTLYFLLTGHAPFPRGTLTERLLMHQKEEPASIFTDRPDAPATLVDICRRMMIKNPNERIQSAADVASEIRHWLSGRGYTADRESQTGRRLASAFEKSSGSDRFSQLTATPRPPPKDVRRPASSDTVSASGLDTEHEEDLTLAPIDDEDKLTRNEPDSGAGASDVTNVSPSDLDLDEQTLSRIEDELGASTSDSLVDLLHNHELSNVSTSGVVLRKQPKPTSPKWLIIATCSVAALIAIMIVAYMVTA